MAYSYDPIFAVDPNSPSNVARNASILIFDPNDATKTPVTLTDITGSPLANPITVNQHGFGPAIQHETLDRLAWEGADMSGVFTSYEGMKEEAVAAREAAQAAATTAAAEAAEGVASVVADAESAATSAAASATAAAQSAALVNAPADTAIAAAINGTGTATKAALSATYATTAALTPKLDKTEAESTYERPNLNTVVIFGTSISNQNKAPSPHVGSASAGYWSWASVLLGKRLKLINNAGISGNTFAQMRARIDADVIAHNPGWVVVEGGPNDKDRTYADIVADLTDIYTRLLAKGIRVVACTMTPTTAITTTAQKQTYAKVNRWISSYARSTRGMILCDWASALSDPATGNPIANVMPDGTHPSPYGAALMGKALAAALAPVVPADTGLWFPQSNADPYNLITNGCQTGTTGTLNAAGGTGNTATSWTIYNNGGTTAYTAAKVARTDLPGHEWSQITATTGNVDSLKHQAGGITTGWAVGDAILVTTEYETGTDLAGISEFRMDVNQVGGPGLASDLYKGGAEAAITTNPGPAGVLQIEFVVAAGTTQLQVQRIFKATLGTVRWGRCSVYNLTALGLTR